ncbi:cytochrome C [Pseudomonadota bacterium]
MNNDCSGSVFPFARPILTICSLAVFLLSLSACGGGGGSSTSDSLAGDASLSSNDSDSHDDDDDDSSGGGTSSLEYALLAANDLGMHCADLDYQVFSILPPFNVVHAQVIQKGSQGNAPLLLDDSRVTVTYQAASNPIDPAGSDSINTTSENLPGVFKSNFWNDSGVALPAGVPGAGNNFSYGGLAYAPLYPNAPLAGGLLEPPLTLDGLCADPASLSGCPSALSLFEPLPVDTGLPVPDIALFWPETGSPVAELFQQSMPGLSNTPQTFARFDRDLPFFVNFGFGSRLNEVNWFAADGIPLLPVDDVGRSNAYPLMKVVASDNNSGAALASLDVVLPVASEADCQNCHVDPLECLDPRLPANLQSDQCNGSGVSQTDFVVVDIDDAPGDTVEQKLLNAAKTNILRLHDAKHGDTYKNWDAGKNLVAMPCDATADATDPDCIANQTPVQCSRCHYTPALDLLQTGPVDEPEQALKGRQQNSHISMSRAMHGHHGSLPDFNAQPLFPPMPPPAGRNPLQAEEVLEQTCYQCHPGKRTQCLRGAMAAGGVVCQDCHGDMQQVGNDFTLRVNSDNPGDYVLDGSLRVPWASEPGCQSCHTGDASVPNHPPGAIVADDGIRLLQAYSTEHISVPDVAEPVKVASMIQSPQSRFAENRNQNASGETVDVLYRLSKGHGGVMCEGCHNSTHAIWPNPNPAANDNIAANQLQGHSGTLVECDTCHAPDSLGLTLDGPHGMHPVGDSRWNEEHEEIAEHNLGSCKSCHGQQLQGTVLSRMAATRTLKCDDDGAACGRDERITLTKGSEVSCDLCHENPLFDD